MFFGVLFLLAEQNIRVRSARATDCSEYEPSLTKSVLAPLRNASGRSIWLGRAPMIPGVQDAERPATTTKRVYEYAAVLVDGGQVRERTALRSINQPTPPPAYPSPRTPPQLAAFLLYLPVGWSAAVVGDLRHYLSLSRAFFAEDSARAFYVPWGAASTIIALCAAMGAYTAYMFNVRALADRAAPQRLWRELRSIESS